MRLGSGGLWPLPPFGKPWHGTCSATYRVFAPNAVTPVTYPRDPAVRNREQWRLPERRISRQNSALGTEDAPGVSSYSVKPDRVICITAGNLGLMQNERRPF